MFRFHHFEESVASHLKAKGMLFCNLCKLTFYYFTGVDAAAPVPANDDDLSLCQCNSCMARPLLAERGLKDDQFSPQCCVLSPLILPTAPRDARGFGARESPTTGHQQVVDDREGVVISPLRGE